MIIRPEMSGKIIDDSHLQFHVGCKARIISAVDKIKKGGELFKILTGYNFKTDPRWVKNSCNDPSVAALLRILEKYKQSEHRPNRAKILVPLFEYFIGLYASDLFYRERGSWLICELIKSQQDFEVCKIFDDPKTWYPMTRNSEGHGVDGNFYKEENDNPKDIRDEYAIWYDIDITKEQFDVPEERKAVLVAAGIEELKNYPDCTIKPE
jgi:hypothetical protein